MTLRKKKKAVEPAICRGISFISYELETVQSQIEELNDAELYEFAMPHIEMYRHEGMDRLYGKIAAAKKLSKKERIALEAFVLLANTEMGIFDAD